MVSKLKNFLLNFEALASLLLRFGIGIAFIIHGYAKFPLPPAGLVEYFGLPPALATFVALSELLSGIILIVSGFLRNPIGDTLTRFAGLVIVILMTNIFIIAHPDWFITQKLFTSEQIFLFIGGFYFENPFINIFYQNLAKPVTPLPLLDSSTGLLRWGSLV